MRRQARERERDAIDLRAAVAADAAVERRALVEDLERVIDLIGASWRSTHDQISELGAKVAGLRDYIEQTAGSLRQARLETAAPNGTPERP
jgi:hypothetical protein